MTAPALSEFELLVLMTMAAANCSRDKAATAVRLSRPDLVGPPALRELIAENVREKEEQAEIYKLFRAYRFTVRNLSQARAAKQAPGLGDAWVVHRELPIAFWWESKRQVGGELSDAQIEMRDDSWRCGVRYYHGDRYDAAKLIVEFGLAEAGNGPCGIVPIIPPRASSSGK